MISTNLKEETEFEDKPNASGLYKNLRQRQAKRYSQKILTLSPSHESTIIHCEHACQTLGLEVEIDLIKTVDLIEQELKAITGSVNNKSGLVKHLNQLKQQVIEVMPSDTDLFGRLVDKIFHLIPKSASFMSAWCQQYELSDRIIQLLIEKLIKTQCQLSDRSESLFRRKKQLNVLKSQINQYKVLATCLTEELLQGVRDSLELESIHAASTTDKAIPEYSMSRPIYDVFLPNLDNRIKKFNQCIDMIDQIIVVIDAALSHNHELCHGGEFSVFRLQQSLESINGLVEALKITYDETHALRVKDEFIDIDECVNEFYEFVLLLMSEYEKSVNDMQLLTQKYPLKEGVEELVDVHQATKSRMVIHF